MWRWLAIALLVAAPAWAVDQPLQNYIVPTAPVGTNNNQAASTAFVQGAFANILSTPNTWSASQTFSAGIQGNNSPFTSSFSGNAPYYLTASNAPNSYSTIYNGMQVSMGSPILATSQFGSNAVGIQQALVATVNVQAGDAAGNAAFALAGYGITNSTTTGAVGVGGFAMCGASGCNEIDGANQVVANAPTLQGSNGFDFTLMLGNQVNINLRQKAGAVNPSGPLYGYYVVGGGNATNNTGNAYAADQLSIVTAAKWTNSFSSFNGAAVTALSVGTVSGTAGAPPANSASQPIVFNSYNASVNNQTTLNTDNAGDLLIGSPSGIQMTFATVPRMDFGISNGANWTFTSNIFFSGIVSATAGVASTSTITGTFRLTGGMGVTGAAWIGGLLNVGAGVTAQLPTSAGGGGIFVCVDTSGVFYKKATCP